MIYIFYYNKEAKILFKKINYKQLTKQNYKNKLT